MKRTAAVSLSLLGALFGAATAVAGPDAANAIAVVNGTAIPALYAQVVREERMARGQKPEEINEEAVRQLLINVEIQAQAAEQKGLDKPEKVRAILDMQRKESLVKLLQEDFVRTHQVPDEQIRAEYDKAKARAGDTEYHVRHILVADEGTAKELIAKLSGKKKQKFEDLAKANSKDPAAKEGGDLGWITPASIVPEFANAMLALKKGEFTAEPVQTRAGWHIIKLEDTRKLEFPPYEKTKDRIAGELMQLEYRKYVEDLRAKAKIEGAGK